MALDASGLTAVLKELAEAAGKKDVEDAVRVLKRLQAEVQPTEELLRATKAGALVAKHRNSEFPGIAGLAKEIVKQWKEAIEVSRKRKREADGEGEGEGGAGSGDDAKKVKVEGSSSVPPPPAAGDGSATKDTKPRRPSLQLSSSDVRAANAGSAGSDIKPKAGSSSRSRSASPSAQPPTPSTPAASSLNMIDSERKVPRTAKSDQVDGKLRADTADEGGAADPIRDKGVLMFYEAMASDSTAQVKIITERAVSIERAVYKLHNFQTNNDYRAKLRSLFLNLKDKGNPGLRNEIVVGNISAEQVVKMSKEDMASESVKAMNEKIASDNLFKAKAVGETQAETDAFKCGRCGQRKCTYYQMQTRSADEPMTTFVTCTNCGNRWKFS